MSKRPSADKNPPEPDGWADSAETWSKRAGPHNVTLKSGQKVTFRLMALGELALRGAVPTELNDLVSLGLMNKSTGGVDAALAAEALEASTSPEAHARFHKHLAESWELTKLLTIEATVSPTVTMEMIEGGDVPFEDLEELALLIQGRQPFDSRGVTIGVEPIETLAQFPEKHGCAQDCQACRAALQELSSVHVGAL